MIATEQVGQVQKKRGGARPGAGRKTDLSIKTAREAVALFVQSNIPRLNGWLEQVACGLPKVDRNGDPLRDDKGSVIFVVKPDPMGAIKCVESIADFYLPRLSRQESHVIAQVENAASIPMVERVSRMSTAEIKALLAQSVEDVPHRTIEQIEQEPLPDWLKSD